MNDSGKLFLGLQHIGIPTADLEKTIAFYEQFGFMVEHQALDARQPVAPLAERHIRVAPGGGVRALEDVLNV